LARREKREKGEKVSARTEGVGNTNERLELS
jgi:hypothetical protein